MSKTTVSRETARAARAGLLTPAELRLVRAILDGHTSAKDLVAHLRHFYNAGRKLSQRTINSQMYSIYQKTGAGNKAQLVLMARGEIECAIDLAGQLAQPVQQRRPRKRRGDP